MIIGDSFLIDTGNPISKNLPVQTDNDGGDGDSPGKFDELFSTVFSASNTASRELSQESRESSAMLVTGQLDDLTGHLVTGEKSSTAFELNLNVRNKVLDAYSELMKTQV